MDELTVGEAAARTGWSPRMLRYIEASALVVPRRTRAFANMRNTGSIQAPNARFFGRPSASTPRDRIGGARLKLILKSPSN